MRIVFHSISWKNLNATGATPITLSLDSHPSTLFVGENGAGKTTAIDALCYALFKRPFEKDRVLGQLLNTSTGKALWVRVDFSVDATHWRIKRGMKPAILDIWQDGKPLNSSSIKDTQAFIENDILRMDFATFLQMVVLGKRFVPFMQMKAAERRDFVEQLASLQVFGEMSDALKEEKKALDRVFSDTRTKLVIETSKLETKKKHLIDLQQIASVHDSKLVNLKAKLDAALALQEMASKSLATLTEHFNREEFEETVAEYQEARDAYQRMYSKQTTLFNQIKDAEKAKLCPTCGQAIKRGADHSEHLAKLKKEYESFCEKVELVLNERENLDIRVQQGRESLKKIEAVERQLRDAERDIIRAERDIDDHQNTPMIDLTDHDAQIRAQEMLVDRLDREVTELTDEITLYETAIDVLRDDGVKAYVMSMELPRMNDLINASLKRLGLNMKFTLNPTFDETIKYRGTESLSYASFSNGQKQRMDLAILFAWRDLAMQKNSLSTNLLFMDEVLDSSMDNKGCEAFLKSFIATAGEKNNIFIISHRGEGIHDQFSRVFEFEMRGNFTKMRDLNVHSGT